MKKYSHSQVSDLHYNVMPHTEYALAVWDPHKHKYIQLLEKVQCRAAR